MTYFNPRKNKLAVTEESKTVTVLDQAKNPRFFHIDAMRAFAVGLVIFAHTDVGSIPGGSGVTIFFTISGFVITNLLLKEKINSGKFSIRHFYWRRFLKLAPPFLIIIFFPTLVYAIWNPITWPAFLSQIFFFFNWVGYILPKPIYILPGSSVVWSLSIEEQFYLAFAFVWFLMVRTRIYTQLLIMFSSLVVLTALIIRIIYALNGVSSGRIYSGTDTRMDSIALGVLVAVLYQYISLDVMEKTKKILQLDAVLFISLGIYLLSLVVRDPFFRDTFRYSLQGIAASGVIIYGLLETKTRTKILFFRVTKFRWVQVLGLASYSLYLSHKPIMNLVESFFSSTPVALKAMAGITISITIGLLLWRFVEKPIERLKNKVKM